ncbi:MAG: single-stranded-DNA-specific exonuclease RecJ [Candidatus Marinimicrobia bacterium CG08_land_8_20_14_0_20_45_22]|nr:MAG: single-stranded-DNA-specific exonuclease RecJ [Candidatus Marinimicrobia bacterium CG08_land_8_20_14_0_20_45_22]
MKQNWIFAPAKPQIVREISTARHLPHVIAAVLANRNFSNPDAIDRFFNPSLDDLHDPFLMTDMRKAVTRLEQAMMNKESVVICGDYDVDGTTATSLLFLSLREIGFRISYYIPDRDKEGYGLSKHGIDYAIHEGASLIITCDCGINANNEVEYANQNHVDVIVTDHHEPSETLPPATAILDPKRGDDSYPFKDLCGAGVAFKLLQGFLINNNLPLEDIYRHLDLVAIGTAADIVTILDENRTMVAKGIETLNASQKIGVQALVKVSGFENKKMNVVNIVFGLAPRINAAGRLGEATRAVRLLTSFNQEESNALSAELEQENKNRQSIERETINSAILQLNATHDLDSDKILILSDTNWHHGVIGIVASKFKETYNRPVVMIAFQNGIGRGSARSIHGFDLYAAFSQCSDLLDNYGGHKMAAGLTISEKNLPAFISRLKTIAAKSITDEMLFPGIYIDTEIQFSEINHEVLDYLNKMSPYGPGNMRPVFVARNLQIHGMPRIVGEQHLKFKVSKDRTVFGAIGWKMGEFYEMLISNRPLDMAFVIEENEWNGNKEIQLSIKDIRYSESTHY